MKLRIRGNSLRLRVTQSEVARLRDGGRIESFVELTPGRPLFYILENSIDAGTVTACFDGHTVHVGVPANVVAEWADSEQVSIYGRSAAGAQLLIEKDFQCLHKSDQEPDAYPNPFLESTHREC